MVRENKYMNSSGNWYGSSSSPTITRAQAEEEMMMVGGGGGEGGNRKKGIVGVIRGYKPAWLQGLMEETFFGGCGVHENYKKNEKNVFCLLCCLTICPHCLPSHTSHPLLQVRRYVYHDVVRLGDLEKLIDCSYIQPYTINSAKVIFLNQRPQSRSKGSANICFTCDRILQEPYHFCSLSCKVDHLVDQGVDLSTILYRIDESDFPFAQFEGLRMDASEITEDDGQNISSSSILEDAYQYKDSTCSNVETMGNSGVPQEVEVVKKTKKFLPGMNMFSLGSRRKSAPHRAPLS